MLPLPRRIKSISILLISLQRFMQSTWNSKLHSNCWRINKFNKSLYNMHYVHMSVSLPLFQHFTTVCNTYYFVCVQTVRELSSSHFYSRDFSVSDPFDLEFYYRIAIQIINRLVSETTSWVASVRHCIAARVLGFSRTLTVRPTDYYRVKGSRNYAMCTKANCWAFYIYRPQ